MHRLASMGFQTSAPSATFHTVMEMKIYSTECTIVNSAG
jgi:hypothetical protein